MLSLFSSKLKGCNTYVSYHIQKLEGFLYYLERIQSPLRPKLPTARLIWPHHYPPLDNQKPTQIKYIPQTVLAQFDAHLHHLPASQIPVMILLRASGWRLSDVLYLKLDTCLEQHGDKFWLVGDIGVITFFRTVFPAKDSED